jgi:hypothetical protein
MRTAYPTCVRHIQPIWTGLDTGREGGVGIRDGPSNYRSHMLHGSAVQYLAKGSYIRTGEFTS